MKKYIFVSIVILAVVIPVLGQSRAKINRVHPPRNSEQYRKEADRVHLEILTEKLGLSEKQVEKLRKENTERQKKETKASEKLKKAQIQDSVTREKIALDYDVHLQKILTPEQYKAYREWLRDNALPSCEPDSMAPGPGPVVKGPDPILLTE